MKTLRYFALGILTVGMVMYVSNIFAKRKVNIERHPFTLTTAKFRIINNGPPLLEYVATRFARTSSYWKEIRTDVRSQTIRTQEAKEGGIYDVGAEKKEWLSKTTDMDEWYTDDTLRANPQFVRTEQLLGLTVYVLRLEISSEDWSETYHAPETGRTPFKIHNSYHGGKEQYIVEPMSLTFGEIPDSVFAGPDLPVSFEHIQELIKDAEKRGNHDI